MGIVELVGNTNKKLNEYSFANPGLCNVNTLELEYFFKQTREIFNENGLQDDFYPLMEGYINFLMKRAKEQNHIIDQEYLTNSLWKSEENNKPTKIYEIKRKRRGNPI